MVFYSPTVCATCWVTLRRLLTSLSLSFPILKVAIAAMPTVG